MALLGWKMDSEDSEAVLGSVLVAADAEAVGVTVVDLAKAFALEAVAKRDQHRHRHCDLV